MPARTRKFALIDGIVAGFSFGTAAILIRFLQDLDSFSIAFWRLAVACVFLALAIVVLGKPFEFKVVRMNMKELCVLSFFLGLHFILFASAVKDTTIMNATVLVNTTPVFSMLVSSLLFRTKPSRIAAVGLTVSFVGACVIGYAGTATAGQVSYHSGYSPSLKGDLEAVLAALVEAFYLNYGRRIRNRMGLLSIMLPVYVLTAIVVGFLSVPALGRVLSLPTNVEAILVLVGLGVLPTAVAHTLYFSSLSHLKSFETAAMALLEPIGATILGLSLFQEVPAPFFVFGAALVLIGILFIVRGKD